MIVPQRLSAATPPCTAVSGSVPTPALPRKAPTRHVLKSCALWAAVLVTAIAPPAMSFDPVTDLPQVSYHMNGISYYGSTAFGNALYLEGRNWRVKKPKPGGQSWEYIFVEPAAGQVDNLGNPVYLNTGETSFLAHPGQNSSDNQAFAGRVVLEWQGDADIRITNASSFDSAASNGASSGILTNGRRVYQTGSNPNGCEIQVFAITSDTTKKPKNIRLWLPDPANPTGASLVGAMFHPRLLARLADRDWKYIRFMDWLPTNASPQQDWADRRLPGHTFQDGVINSRSPAPGVVWYTDSNGNPVYFPGNKATGVAFEHMVALCNASNKSLWINIPHLATDDYITKLAQLIRYGSDGVNPYTSTQTSPVYAPLNSSLKVYIEYSNEIWSNGGSFPQGNWAEYQGQQQSPAISKAKFNARRFSQAWRIFQDVFGGNTRLVKVAAAFTGSQSYTQEFLNEIKAYGPPLSPAQEPDVIACTTYFGNDIQGWAYKKAQDQIGTSDEWFFKGYYDDDPGTGVRMKPESKPLTDPYWTSAAFERHMAEAYSEWTRRLLNGSSQNGAGFDQTGVGGGFDQWLRTLADTTWTTKKPIVAYEGGPSIYTDSYDGGDSRDDGITNFMVRMNRLDAIGDVYYLHLNQAKQKGLWAHSAFVDTGGWGKYGQWGHIEGGYSKDPATQPKWQFLLDWTTEASGLRHPDRPLNQVPSFVTGVTLPTGVVGSSYSQDITVTGGNGTLSITLLGALLSPGLHYESINATTARIRGTPLRGGENYVYLRVKDGDNDPAWRTFKFYVAGDYGTLVESNLTGTNPGQNLPWTSSWTIHPDVTFSGINKGSGVTGLAGNDAIFFRVADTSDEAQNTLAAAISTGDYLTVTISPNAGKTLDLRGSVLDFTIQRDEYHAPRAFAICTNIGGFTESGKIYDTGRFTSQSATPFTVRFPETTAYSAVSTPVEVRIYPYSGQYGHKVSLRGLKLKLKTSYEYGLTSEFFDYTSGLSAIPDFTGKTPDVVRYEPNLNFTSTSAAWIGLSSGFADQFASRHSGYVYAPTTGSYTFYINSDDGSKLYVNNTLLINNDGLHGMREYSGTVSLSAGFHQIRAEFFEATGGAGLIMSWAGPGITKQVIPVSSLFHAQ